MQEEALASLKGILREGLNVSKSDELEVFSYDMHGFRVAEVSVHSNKGGYSFMRGTVNVSSMALIFACENYVCYFDDPDTEMLRDAEELLQLALASLD